MKRKIKKKTARKIKKRFNQAFLWLSGISLTLFILTSVLIGYEWISNNKISLFVISGVFTLIFILLGYLNPKMAKNTLVSRTKRKFS